MPGKYRYEKGREFRDGFKIIGETSDGMPVCTKNEEWYFLTDGEMILTNGYSRIDSIGRFRYVAWVGTTDATEVTLDAGMIDFDSLEEIRTSHELK